MLFTRLFHLQQKSTCRQARRMETYSLNSKTALIPFLSTFKFEQDCSLVKSICQGDFHNFSFRRCTLNIIYVYSSRQCLALQYYWTIWRISLTLLILLKKSIGYHSLIGGRVSVIEYLNPHCFCYQLLWNKPQQMIGHYFSNPICLRQRGQTLARLV